MAKNIEAWHAPVQSLSLVFLYIFTKLEISKLIQINETKDWRPNGAAASLDRQIALWHCLHS